MAKTSAPMRGRPAKLADGHAQNVYITEDMADWLKASAERSYISVSAQIRIVLDAAMRAEARHA